jgi:DNA-binding NtrC family response regulator
MREWHARDEAWQRARSFARRFGEPHVRLAMHGAVPIGLTPELLHLIRVNFVTATPWVAESDLLLSPLCRDVGGGFFEMDEELRGLLVEELQRDPDFGPRRLRDVADFLGAWADRVRESASDQEWSDFVEGQALTALSYRKPEEAAEALARSLNSPQRGRAGIDARVIKLTQGLSSALVSQVEVVTYAVALDKLAAGDVEAALERFGALGAMDQPVKIGNVELPAPMEWGVAGQDEAMADRSEESAENVWLIGKSEAMRKVREMIRRIAHTDVTALILGETGTGKSLAARTIYLASSRAKGPFIAISCGSLPEALVEEELFGRRGQSAMTGRRAGKGGALEAARGGTLFLDEVGDLSQGLQEKILRVLQQREFTQSDGARVRIDVRIIAATHRNLEIAIAAGRFSEALFHRFNVLPISMPPLRERGEDIVILAEHFASEFARRVQRATPRIPPEVRERLLHYEWPGNVRELENVIERAVIMSSGGEISFNDLPPEIRNAPGEKGRVLVAFSSNVSPDQSVAARIAEFLNSAGYDVFQAPQDLASDSGMTRMILSRMHESKAVIVVYGSSSEWLTRMAEVAIRENVTLLPVMLARWMHPQLLVFNNVIWEESLAETSLQSLKAALEGLTRPTDPKSAFPRVLISCPPENWPLAAAIRERLQERGRSALLAESHAPPRWEGESNLHSLLVQGNLVVLVLSEDDATNKWLQDLSGITMPLRNQILPIRIGKHGSTSQPPNWLRRFPWFDESTRTAPEILARIDRFIAAHKSPPIKSTDDIYIETAAAREALQPVISGSSLIVSASRRSGKTALLRYLQRSLEQLGIAAQYVREGEKYDLTSNAVLLIDDVKDPARTYRHFARSQRKAQNVWATPAATDYYGQSVVIELPDFLLEETHELNRKLGSRLRPRQVEELFDILEGHPYLTRAAITSSGQDQTIDVRTISQLPPIREELERLDHELGDSALKDAWNSLLSGTQLSLTNQDALLALGLAKKQDGRLIPRNRLYREFFAAPRQALHTVLISTPDRDLPCARAARAWLENRNDEVLEFDEFRAPTESHDPRLEHLLDRADLVIGLIAEPFGGRGNLAEIEMAFERYRREGRPKILAVLVRRDAPPSELLSEIPFLHWNSDSDTPGLLREIAARLGDDAQPR